jgi:hypothetical protein
MSALPAAQFLADFGADADAPRSQASGAKGGATAAGPSAQAKLEESYSRGVLAGRAAAQGQYNAKLEDQRTAAAAKHAAERENWARETGGMLVERLQAAVRELEVQIADATARILKPFLGAELHRQAIAELQANLNVLLTSDPSVSIHISGPADVLEAFRAQLEEKTITATYIPSDTCDVKIVAGQASLETCLWTWMNKIEEAVR